MNQGRVRVQAVVSRDQIVNQLGGWWRRILPRFAPLTITLAAFDGTTEQAGELNGILSRYDLSPVLFVSFEGIRVVGPV